MNEMMNPKDIMQFMQQVTTNIALQSEQMGIVMRTMSEINDRVGVIEDRMQNYEDRIRLDRDQARRLKNAIHGRVDHLLRIEHNGGVVARESISNDVKYRGRFLNRCYFDARKYSRLGTPYYDTYQRDFSEVMDYISKWQPEVTFDGFNGVEAYKRYLDVRASEREK